jgi:hypothetical protein
MGSSIQAEAKSEETRMSNADRLATEIDDMLERVEALFPNPKANGFGKDFRRLLDVAEYHRNRFTFNTSVSILNVIDELITRMEDDNEQDV